MPPTERRRNGDYYELNKDRILSNSTDQEIREFLQRVLRRGLGEVPARESSILEKSENLKGIFEDRCKKVKERKDEVDSQKPFLKETCEIVSKELEKAQYRDFRSVLENLGDITKDCNGKIMCCINKLIPLLAGVQLFRLCNEVLGNKTKISIEELCFNITALIEKILKAKYVQIILECPLECDEWEDLLIDRYNNLVTTLGEENGENIILKNHYKKEYLVIADSGVPDIRQIGIEDASMKVRNRLKKCSEDPEYEATGLFVDPTENYAVWGLSNDSASSQIVNRQLLIYVDFYELKLPRDWHRLRNLVCMNYMINHRVFVDDVKDYIIELMLADKERLMYYMDKAHSHTAVTVKSRQFDAVQLKEESKADTRSFVLTLLSDLKVSQVYRQSLKNNYYCSEAIGIRKRNCGEILRTFYQGVPLSVVDQLEEPGRKYVEVLVEFPEYGKTGDTESSLRGTDELLVYEDSSGASELFLLLLALVMNAASPGRGADSSDVTENREGIRQIKVFITKTEDKCLRISNECVETIETQGDIQQLNEELKYPPRMDRGISLWSVSRYVKGIISILLVQRINRVSKKIIKSPATAKEEVAVLKDILERVLGAEFEVRAGSVDTPAKKKYFYIDIPIMASKYEELFKNELEGNA